MGSMQEPSPAFQILSGMITPAVLISASGLLVLSTSNRLSRVVDRVRVLAEKVRPERGGAQEEAEYREWILDQLSRLGRRALLLRSALTSLYLAIALFVITSISFGLLSVFGPHYNWIAVITGLIGSCVLLYGSVLLISEGRVAIDSILQEMNFIRRGVIVASDTSGRD